MIARIRELGVRPNGWDGADAVAPSKATINDAEEFTYEISVFDIALPHIAIATDGEMNFIWNVNDFKLDLGMYGDGTFSYYGKDSDGHEFFADDIPVQKGLPVEIVNRLSV